MIYKSKNLKSITLSLFALLMGSFLGLGCSVGEKELVVPSNIDSLIANAKPAVGLTSYRSAYHSMIAVVGLVPNASLRGDFQSNYQNGLPKVEPADMRLYTSQGLTFANWTARLCERGIINGENNQSARVALAPGINFNLDPNDSNLTDPAVQASIIRNISSRAWGRQADDIEVAKIQAVMNAIRTDAGNNNNSSRRMVAGACAVILASASSILY